MKRLITIIITVILLLGLSYTFTYFTHTKFIDYSFIVGLISTVIIWFFASKGGLTSKNAEMIIQAQTGIKVEQQKYEFLPNVVFITSLSCTVIFFVAMLFHYRSYL
jgi:hypothetical protein